MAVLCFSVQADATPGTLSRVLDVFELFGFVPTQCHSNRGGANLSDLMIDVQVEGATPDEAAAMARRLGRVVSVIDVLWSEKARCAA